METLNVVSIPNAIIFLYINNKPSFISVMTRKILTYACLISCCLFMSQLMAMPKIVVKHQNNRDGFAMMNVTNKTTAKLICSVTIDGHKRMFRLNALRQSKWFTATDKRFNHTHFSVWCDYLSLHPKHQNK